MKRLKKMITTGMIAASVFGTVCGINSIANTVEAATNKTITIEGQNVSVPSTGHKWVNLKGYWHFVKDGVLVKGWKWFTSADGEKVNHWSYFDKNGRIYTNWKSMGKNEGEKVTHWSYFGPNGWLRTSWQAMGKGTSNPDGNQPWHMSYFGSNGWLRTGWVKLGKGTSEPDGNSAVHWSYFGPNGWLRTGWQSLGKGTNNPDGNSAKHTSFFGGNGWLRTGLITFKKGTANSDGNSPVHQSYFGNNGWLVVNKSFTLSGTTYKADSKGWLTKHISNNNNNNNSGSTTAHTHNWKFVPATKCKYHWTECLQCGYGFRTKDGLNAEKEYSAKMVPHWKNSAGCSEMTGLDYTDIDTPSYYICTTCGAKTGYGPKSEVDIDTLRAGLANLNK